MNWPLSNGLIVWTNQWFIHKVHYSLPLTSHSFNYSQIAVWTMLLIIPHTDWKSGLVFHISLSVNWLISWAGNTPEAEASQDTLRHPWCAPLCTKECFQFLGGVGCSVHTAHKEGNFSGLPHFDLPTTNDSDCSSLWGMWLDLLPHLH